MVNARRFPFPSGPALLKHLIQASKNNSSRAAVILVGCASLLIALASLTRIEGLKVELIQEGRTSFP